MTLPSNNLQGRETGKGMLSIWRGDVSRRRQVNTLAEARQIAASVAADHNLTFDELTAPTRTTPVVRARWAAMEAIRATGRYSLPRIATALGLKDHTTVINGLRRHAELAREWAR